MTASRIDTEELLPSNPDGKATAPPQFYDKVIAAINEHADGLDGLSPTSTIRVFNIKEYGAVGDGATDDTVAIQAAIDAAHNAGGNHDAIVWIPSSSTPYRFSNLKLWAYSILHGARMGQTVLQRIPGSTGNAITEHAAADGNTLGATAIWIQDLAVDGNGTVGNGIDLGFGVAGHNFETWATLERVFVYGFTSGIGIHAAANAISMHYIYALGNQDGIHLTGGYCQIHSAYAEQNSRYQIRASGVAHTFFGIHCEPGSSTSPAILVEGGSQSFYGVTIYFSVAIPKVIELAAGTTKTQFHDVWFDTTGGGSFTNGIYHDDYVNGRTGTTPYIQHYEMGDGSVASWYINADTGKSLKRVQDTHTGDFTLAGNLSTTGNTTLGDADTDSTTAFGSITLTAPASSSVPGYRSKSTGLTPQWGFGQFDNDTSWRFYYNDGASWAERFRISNTGDLVMSTGASIKSGSGTPEGAVTAAVGSLYLRTNGGASTTLYVKESGTGNTGWVAK